VNILPKIVENLTELPDICRSDDLEQFGDIAINFQYEDSDQPYTQSAIPIYVCPPSPRPPSVNEKSDLQESPPLPSATGETKVASVGKAIDDPYAFPESPVSEESDKELSFYENRMTEVQNAEEAEQLIYATTPEPYEPVEPYGRRTDRYNKIQQDKYVSAVAQDYNIGKNNYSQYAPNESFSELQDYTLYDKDEYFDDYTAKDVPSKFNAEDLFDADASNQAAEPISDYVLPERSPEKRKSSLEFEPEAETYFTPYTSTINIRSDLDRTIKIAEEIVLSEKSGQELPVQASQNLTMYQDYQSDQFDSTPAFSAPFDTNQNMNRQHQASGGTFVEETNKHPRETGYQQLVMYEVDENARLYQYMPSSGYTKEPQTSIIRSYGSESSSETVDTGYMSHNSPYEEDFRNFSSDPTVTASSSSAKAPKPESSFLEETASPKQRAAASFNPFLTENQHQVESVPPKATTMHPAVAIPGFPDIDLSSFNEEERQHLIAMFCKANELEYETYAGLAKSEASLIETATPSSNLTKSAAESFQRSSGDTFRRSAASGFSRHADMAPNIQQYDSSEVSSEINDEEDQQRMIK